MRKRSIFQWLLIAGIVAIFMFGCSSNDANDVENDEPTTEPDEEVTESASFPLEITDSTGNTITLESEPEEIISLIPSNTEILFALGLGSKVIAVTEND